MPRIVPEPDDGLARAMFGAETGRAQAGSAQKKILPSRRYNAQPLSAQHPQEMAAGKKEDGSRNGSQTAHYTARPRAYLVRRFAARAPVAEELPVGPQGVNLRRGVTLIFAVIPFRKLA